MTIQANRRHLYPIQLLQQALRLLADEIFVDMVAHSHASKSSKTPSIETPSDKASSNSIFDLLDLQETIDDDDDATVRSPNAAGPSATNTSSSASLKARMQDEFNVAMYCLHADLDELKDYLVLELVRYAIDQKNADTLPFLINTAIDRALYMQEDLCKLVDDSHLARQKIEEFDHRNNSREKHKQKRPASSLRRLQGIIGVEMSTQKVEKIVFARMAKENGSHICQHGRIPFPYKKDDMNYLTASITEK